MFFVLGTLTQDWLLSQINGTNYAISFQEKASNNSSVSNCELMGNFAFLYSILGIMFWAPGISLFLTAGRLPEVAFVLGASLSSHSAGTWWALHLGQESQESQDTQAHTASSSLSLERVQLRIKWEFLPLFTTAGRCSRITQSYSAMTWQPGPAEQEPGDFIPATLLPARHSASQEQKPLWHSFSDIMYKCWVFIVFVLNKTSQTNNNFFFFILLSLMA